MMLQARDYDALRGIAITSGILAAMTLGLIWLANVII